VSPRAPRRGMPITRRRSPGPPSWGPGPPRVSQTSWCARLHSVQGVQDRRVPHPRRCTQDFDLRGPPNATASHMEDRTSNSDDHAARKDWQDVGTISARPRTISTTAATPNAMPHSVLSTVSDHCTPRFGGKRRLPRPHSCAPPLLVTIKGGDGPPLDGTMLQTRSIITYAPASLFATFNPSSSRDLGAFLPLSPRLYPLLQALRVQDNTVPSHTPFAGRTAPRPEPG